MNCRTSERAAVEQTNEVTIAATSDSDNNHDDGNFFFCAEYGQQSRVHEAHTHVLFGSEKEEEVKICAGKAFTNLVTAKGASIKYIRKMYRISDPHPT